MFPLKVSDDYAVLLKGNPDALQVLDHYNVDVVLWDRTLPLVTVLNATGKWRQEYRKDDWVVLHRA